MCKKNLPLTTSKNRNALHGSSPISAHIYFPIEGKRPSLATQAPPSLYSEPSVGGQPSPGNQAVNNRRHVTQNAFAHLCSNSSRPQSVPCHIEYRSTAPPEASLPAAIRSISHQAPQSKARQNQEPR